MTYFTIRLIHHMTLGMAIGEAREDLWEKYESSLVSHKSHNYCWYQTIIVHYYVMGSCNNFPFTRITTLCRRRVQVISYFFLSIECYNADWAPQKHVDAAVLRPEISLYQGESLYVILFLPTAPRTALSWWTMARFPTKCCNADRALPKHVGTAALLPKIPQCLDESPAVTPFVPIPGESRHR